MNYLYQGFSIRTDDNRFSVSTKRTSWRPPIHLADFKSLENAMRYIEERGLGHPRTELQRA